MGVGLLAASATSRGLGSHLFLLGGPPPPPSVLGSHPHPRARTDQLDCCNGLRGGHITRQVQENRPWDFKWKRCSSGWRSRGGGRLGDGVRTATSGPSGCPLHGQQAAGCPRES